MQNPDTISRRESPTRGSRPKSRMERKSAGGPHRSSITIGNKSKADATGCCLRGQPSSIPPPLSLPRRFFSPPADNTTVFNKYKTIHETVSTPFHFIYIYIYTLPWHPPRIPRGSLDFNKLMRLSKWISSLEYTQLSVN